MKGKERFLKSCFCENTDRPPVWLMRQAGRYLPEYQKLRAENSFLKLLCDENLITEISLQPWRRFKMDAVIVFSDILLLPMVKGMELKFLEGQGPKFPRLLASETDLQKLKKFNPADIPYLTGALQTIKKIVGEDAALIGFAGSPWTVASYITKDFDTVREKNPRLLKSILDLLTQETIIYLQTQIFAGVDAIQIFDSWGGILSPEDYREWSLPYIRSIFDALRPTKIPTIIYVRDSAHLLEEMIQAGSQVISVGHETSLKTARDKAAGKRAIQGNLNPHILMNATPAEVRQKTGEMLKEMSVYKGYIANLGHGILPKTPLENVEAFVNTICTRY